MSRILRCIEQHYGEDLTLSDLASAAGISKSEASRCFHKVLGQTPYRYLVEYRLSKAATLLSGTDIPVGEVAGRVGFNSMSHFGELFKKRNGSTPKEYRNARTEAGAVNK